MERLRAQNGKLSRLLPFNATRASLTSLQAWGFQIIKGERKHVKRIVLTLLDPNKQRSPVQVRLVYDYGKKYPIRMFTPI